MKTYNNNTKPTYSHKSSFPRLPVFA